MIKKLCVHLQKTSEYFKERIKMFGRLKRFGSQTALADDMSKRKGKIKLYFIFLIMLIFASVNFFGDLMQPKYAITYYSLFGFYIVCVIFINFFNWFQARAYKKKLKSTDRFWCSECGAHHPGSEVIVAWLIYDKPTPICPSCKVPVFQQ